MTRDRLIKKYSQYFSMAQICEKAGVNYNTFRGWNNRGLPLSDEKKDKIIEAMVDMSKEIVRYAKGIPTTKKED